MCRRQGLDRSLQSNHPEKVIYRPTQPCSTLRAGILRPRRPSTLVFARVRTSIAHRYLHLQTSRLRETIGPRFQQQYCACICFCLPVPEFRDFGMKSGTLQAQASFTLLLFDLPETDQTKNTYVKRTNCLITIQSASAEGLPFRAIRCNWSCTHPASLPRQ